MNSWRSPDRSVNRASRAATVRAVNVLRTIESTTWSVPRVTKPRASSHDDAERQKQQDRRLPVRAEGGGVDA